MIRRAFHALVLTLALAAVSLVAAPPGGAAADSGAYIHNTYDIDLCLTALGNGTNAQVYMDKCGQHSYQLWHYPSSGGAGEIQLVNSSGECLRHTTVVETQPTSLYPCTSADNRTYQWWTMHPLLNLVNGRDRGLVGPAGASIRLSVQGNAAGEKPVTYGYAVMSTSTSGYASNWEWSPSGA